ncbi:hypothetical protein M9H77_24852 [Catharanthus roseus]|uniref:Uncharacterized protein n=1 Tax=Catharanthus roseus TaxID=4058 RepID=A0ACC0A625_CATRO|nr:hypothetical protein M9H77_24852 [Catharanthus roseus]
MISPPPVSSKTISATVAAPQFPPKPPKSPPLPLPQRNSSLHKISTISRRNASSVLFSILIAPPASALSFGISGPKEWLKEQKKKSYKYLLAPIDASRNSLSSAYLIITKGESEYEEKDLEEVRNLVNSAARDCVAEDRNSFVAFQAKTGVEVCTFRLIVKNAASLLDDKDPIKLEAEVKLADLIRAFASLSDMTSKINVQVASDRQRIANALMDTLFSLENFERGVKDCLEI